MADEFAKGLGILTGAGLAWMVLAGWYATPSFESTRQLITPVELGPNATIWDEIGRNILMPGMLWFAIIGALTFWVVVPMVNEARETLAERRS